ncbi:MAG: DNA primase [Acetobacteraceae bacterium]|nr:DNA primase [Acetobacteraceae bacterium]
MALPDGFLAELRARTSLQGLVGRRVKLSKSGRNWKGCCPFHNEKTPSFYVYEDAYHCFGCGVHGDAISYVMHILGASFPEAVQTLASEAGMEVPKPTPAAAAAERARMDLGEVLTAAAAFYQTLLPASPGLAYLRNRGLSDDTIARFDLGWSGDGRGGLIAELARHDVKLDMLIEAGLVREAEDGRPAREQFYNRVMFPIRDRRGQVVSFGGRILGDGQPKYVNGPETPVFSKRRMLYGLDFARAAARAGQPVVVVEGYMDVIALHQAGFGGAVAPLGTALTAEQLDELWRLSPNPVLCFDGDAAGARAAMRVGELALPLISAERSLNFVRLDGGDDPDSLVRQHGAPRFRAVLASARPFSVALFDMLHEGVGATAEARAAFRKRLMATTDLITDKALAGEIRGAFFEQIRRLRDAEFSRGRPGSKFTPAVKFARQPPSTSAAIARQAGMLVMIVLHNPGLLTSVDEAFASVALPEPMARLQMVVLDWFHAAEVLDTGALMSHLHDLQLSGEVDYVRALVATDLPPWVSHDAMPKDAADLWWESFKFLNRPILKEQQLAAGQRFARDQDTDSERQFRSMTAIMRAVDSGEDSLDP